MNYENFIARRIAFKKDASFTRTIIRIAIASTALSIIVMILASAVLDGFSREIHAKVFGFWGHIQISNTNVTRNFDLKSISIDEPYYEKLKSIKSVEYLQIDDDDVSGSENYVSTLGGVRHIQPFIIMPALLETKEAFQAVLFKGINEEFDWDNMKKYMISNAPISYDSLESGVLLSKSIASKLALKPNDQLIISFIKNRNKLKRRVEVKGIYNTGLEEYDRRFIIGRIDVAQQILDWDSTEVSGIEVFVENNQDTKVLSEYIYENVIPLDMYCETIQDKFPNIFEWLKLQDINELVIYQLMLIVALINMITVILILVLERSKMIGILKSLGATNVSIKKIFLYNAIYILGWGLLFGNIIGIGLAMVQKQFGIIKLDEVNYYLDTAPIHLDWLNILLINLGSIAIITLALLLPLIIISKITPIKTLRFN